jgi:hypothetical protein
MDESAALIVAHEPLSAASTIIFIATTHRGGVILERPYRGGLEVYFPWQRFVFKKVSP